VSGSAKIARFQRPEEMKTELKIPFKQVDSDPDWLSKKHSGKPLSAQEKEMYLKYKFDKDLAYLKSNFKAPGGQDIINCFMEN
jgi:hypothetical protein